MAKSRNESRDNYKNGNEGLKHRKLKTENRWKFNPNEPYKSEENDNLEEDWSDDLDQKNSY